MFSKIGGLFEDGTLFGEIFEEEGIYDRPTWKTKKPQYSFLVAERKKKLPSWCPNRKSKIPIYIIELKGRSRSSDRSSKWEIGLRMQISE